MLIEILLLNSRPCSTYEILNLPRASHSTSLVRFVLLAGGGGKNHHQTGILFFPEGLRMMTTFLTLSDGKGLKTNKQKKEEAESLEKKDLKRA